MKALSVFVASVALATAIPLSMAIFGVGLPEQAHLGFYDGQDSRIEDPAGDAHAVLQRSAPSIIPEVRGYHDVLAAGISKTGANFTLTVRLAGNPNLNEKYETNYMWHFVSSDQLTGEQHYYVVMFVNFAPDFNHTSQGWYYAVYDRTAERYILPQTQIGEMPADRVEYSIDGSLIGDPSSFRYWVSVYSRVEAIFEGEPEYLMDYAP